MSECSYGLEARLGRVDFAQAIERVTAALKVEGFGVLTEIDVEATLRQKLGVPFRPYVILGACNPPLAHRALLAEPDIGLLLPCNVVVRQEEEEILVSFIDPRAMFSVVDNPGMNDLVDEVRGKLQRVAAALG